MRGIRVVGSFGVGQRRSIPAGAGNPSPRWSRSPLARVHPRGCGESTLAAPGRFAASGPSPRVRGIRHRERERRAGPGSIPAGAGNPRAGLGGRRGRRVHPRGCGESAAAPASTFRRTGPSPRVRGILVWRGANDGILGSIPAGAGNPQVGCDGGDAARVHPRGCGESPTTLTFTSTFAGPSPRVRGIHASAWHAARGKGSIPAGAGNPTATPPRPHRPRVHPRGCGESDVKAAMSFIKEGPSPRVRGIHGEQRLRLEGLGSIPAGAGNPWGRTSRTAAPAVHPRGCGESLIPHRPGRSRTGPSPRVRGIRGQRHRVAVDRGSIPAGAGNPGKARARARRWRVHPRGCGESPRPSASRRSSAGPSPRVRGIRDPEVAAPADVGSIPAGAGNP